MTLGAGKPNSGLTRMDFELKLDDIDRARIEAAVQTPAQRGGAEAIGELKRFVLAARAGAQAPLDATKLGCELDFLFKQVVDSSLGSQAIAAHLLTLAEDSAARPHAGPGGSWRLVIPFDDYPDVLHICGDDLIALPDKSALAIAPGELSSMGCFGPHEAMFLVIDLGPDARPASIDRPRPIKRRRFGPDQHAAVAALTHLINETNCERILDLLCLLPFDFEIDTIAPFDLADDVARRAECPVLADRLDSLRAQLLGSPALERAA